MIKRWLLLLNSGLLLFALLFLAAAGWWSLSPKPPLEIPSSTHQTPTAPTNSFRQPAEAYEQPTDRLFSLNYAPPALQLPNLRNVLVYYGENGRPDSTSEQPALHFGLVGEGNMATVMPNSPLYLVYNATGSPAKYSFSPDNQSTPLWIEAAPAGVNQAHVHLFLRTPDGEVLRKPVNQHQFLLPRKELNRYGNQWQLGSLRVDGTLLARQKARWQGIDRFLERHGGQEYSYAQDKERIDLGEGENLYSLFIDDKSCLIWKQERWRLPDPEEATQAYPLLCVKKIDPRLITFELWDLQGKGRIQINLLKTVDTPPPKQLLNSLKFLGARTLSQFLFEINGERITLRPKDWLIYKENRWELLEEPEMIQSYVDKRLNGPLFVFDQVLRAGDHQLIQGTLFNTSRSEEAEVELPLGQKASDGGGSTSQTNKAVERQERELIESLSDDEDDEDYDDDYE